MHLGIVNPDDKPQKKKELSSVISKKKDLEVHYNQEHQELQDKSQTLLNIQSQCESIEKDIVILDSCLKRCGSVLTKIRNVLVQIGEMSEYTDTLESEASMLEMQMSIAEVSEIQDSARQFYKCVLDTESNYLKQEEEFENVKYEHHKLKVISSQANISAEPPKTKLIQISVGSKGGSFSSGFLIQEYNDRITHILARTGADLDYLAFKSAKQQGGIGNENGGASKGYKEIPEKIRALTAWTYILSGSPCVNGFKFEAEPGYGEDVVIGLTKGSSQRWELSSGVLKGFEGRRGLRIDQVCLSFVVTIN